MDIIIKIVIGKVQTLDIWIRYANMETTKYINFIYGQLYVNHSRGLVHVA